jgi:tyrosyl-tRNA synthetase
MVHGADVEARAATVADALFGDGEGGAPDLRGLSAEALGMLAGELPTSGLPVAADATLVELVIAAGLAASKSEARRLIEQGGISVNGAPAPDGAAAASSFAPLADGSLLLRKGRRDYRLLRRA